MKKIYLFALTAFALFSCSEEEVVIQPVDKVTEEPAQEVQYPGGFYVLNEDWFGHDNGSLNYFKQNGEQYDVNYRVYRAANGGETFGVTSCYGTFWAGNLFVVSKDEKHLVVADAETLKKKAQYTSDERGVQAYSFVGVDDKKAYLGVDNGLYVYDIANMSIGARVEGIGEAVGNMVFSNGKVFALCSKKFYVIDPTADKVLNSISGDFYHVTLDMNGNVIIATSTALVKMNPVTFAQETINYPEGAKIANPWGFAWNPGSLCASITKEIIYWTSGNKVFKTDLTNGQSAQIYVLGKSETGETLSFYGGAMRVDPLTDELVLLVKHSGWGDAGKYNYIYKLDGAGKEICHFAVHNDEPLEGDEVSNYFWFPSLPIFADANKPQILLNKVEMAQKPGFEIDLRKVVVDYDNIFASMIITAEVVDKAIASASIEDGMLNILAGETKGSTECIITVISNGVKVSKTVAIENR